MTIPMRAEDRQECLRAWTVDEADFPAGSTISDALAFCVRYAVLAPSTHNTQPWWFRVRDSRVTVGVDVARGLAVVDPDDRESTISVGAAAFQLRVAMEHFGFRVHESYLPDPVDPAAMVTLTVEDAGPPAAPYEPLFHAIPHRHTSHAVFTSRQVDDLLVATWQADAAVEHARLRILGETTKRERLAKLVTIGDHRQLADKSFRRELASWLRPARNRHGDGIVGYGSDLGALMSVAGPLIVRTFDLGQGRAATDMELLSSSPVLAVLTTQGDDRIDWLHAGQALARVCLRATGAGVRVGFLNQPVEEPELRSRVAEILGTGDVPQLVLRLGYGDPPPDQPRRSLDDVLD